MRCTLGSSKANVQGGSVITKQNLKNRGKYDTYYIAIDDVELIGKKMICVLN